MTAEQLPQCIHVRQLCDATEETGGNVHRCYLDPGHKRGHVCVCWHRWPNDDQKATERHASQATPATTKE